MISTIGAYVLGASLLFTLGYLIVSLFKGRDAGPNPYNSLGFEWRDEPFPQEGPAKGAYAYDE